MPSYFTLTPDEQFRYFATLAEQIRGPVLMYDIPSAVHASIDPGVIEHLRAFSNVIADQRILGRHRPLIFIADVVRR